MTSDCGPEALAAVLVYHGKPADVDEMTKRYYRSDMRGTLSTELANAARERGLAAELITGTLHRIRAEVERDAPSIIMVQVGSSLNHFFVVIGYSDERRELACETYDGYKHVLKYEDLETGWAATKYWMLVLDPASAMEDLEHAEDLASNGRHQEAIPFYRRALKTGMEQKRALTGLGTSLSLTGDNDGARQALEQARELDPQDPLLGNNLADLYLRIGGLVREAGELADAAVQEFVRRRDDLRKQLATTRPVQHLQIRKDLQDIEYYLGGAYGTLGAARRDAGRHDLAIAAWEASKPLIPLDEPDRLAGREFDIGVSFDALGQRATGREHFERAHQLAQDPDLKARIAEKLAPR